MQTKDPVPLCCDIDQIISMAEGFDNTAPFKRCPTCVNNIISAYCQFSCSPNQSDFVTDYKKESVFFGQDYASSVSVNIYKTYMYKIYESCQDVSLPSTGGSVLGSACGNYGATWCTPERWFEYMNDPDQNPFAPFLVTYNSVSDNVSGAMNFTIFNCNESWPTSSACSCVDCPHSCSAYHYDSLDDIHLIFGHATIASLILSSFVFLLGVFSAIAVVMIKFVWTKKHNNRQNVNKCSRNIGNKVHTALEDMFRSLGKTMAEERIKVLIMCLLVVICLSSGIVLIKVTTNPIEIWAAPNSQSRQEKDFFDKYFGPFYRTNQVFIKSVGINPFNFSSTYGGNMTMGPAFNMTFLTAVFDLQKRIENISIETTDEYGLPITKGLQSVCYSPMRTVFSGERSISQCAVISVLGLFDNNITKFNDADYSKNLEKMISCLQAPYSINCLAPYGGPVIPGVAMGGASKENNYLDAVGVTLTFLAENKIDQNELADTLAWEKQFIEFLMTWNEEERPEFMDIAFSAERSIQDEIDKLSTSTFATVVISYSIMFLYITISLGRVTKLSEILLETKILLGVGGIMIVLASVMSAVGICAYAGISTTLITLEVIPFLILAVGVDNVFIIVQAHQRRELNKQMTLEENIGETMAKVGPSMLLTSSSEIFCFATATLSTMPAVHTFALYATVAILFDFLLQITAFVAFLALDQARYEVTNVFVDRKLSRVEDETTMYNKNMSETEKKLSGINSAAWEIRFPVRCTTLVIFTITLCSSILIIPSIEVGLDQELSMPEDSHVLKYLQYMKDLLRTGPPVYWVTKGPIDYFDPDIRSRACGGVGCNEDSISTQIYVASTQSNITYIAAQANSWLDDFKDWSDTEKMENLTRYQYYKKYLPHFLNDNPDPTCAKGGHASYAGGITYTSDDDGETKILSSNVMAYHTVTKTSKDFIGSLKYARQIAKNLTKALNVSGVEIFPYSVFYVYYEQYLTIWRDTLTSLSYSLTLVLAITFIINGFNIFSAIMITLTVVMIVIHLMGMMWLWDITLNAISLVNLVMSVGIAVEFCGHIVHSFDYSQKGSALERATDSLANMGISASSDGEVINGRDRVLNEDHHGYNNGITMVGGNQLQVEINNELQMSNVHKDTENEEVIP
ncbi:hypothetical protein NQ317_007664 [Molorchus minor]|uniref:SSD domain-containing protein n=1 Tax=Molorchus minor TaxID=1323400 RepID=A0ABQ9J1C3_9CUCU|nr:hypothetical protein NQ317_007664 [Molorchus minor]